MSEIWLIRHGETEWSLSGQHTGRTDIPLTENGREQASRLAPKLANVSFDRVLTSPLQRARETAALAGFPEAELCPDLLEWDYGDFEGRTTHDIRGDLPDWTIWEGNIPNGEQAEDVAARAASVIALCPTGRSALFAHGHILRILATQWLGLSPHDGRLLALTTASISRLGWEHETRVITGWNIPS